MTRSFESRRKFMERALGLAEKGRGLTYPNPMVGALLARGSKVIAEGYHRFFGAPHAEAKAIRKAGNKASSTCLYVTLEPCSTFGKTPPCTRLIIEKGIREVVIAAEDPNPAHRGRGIAELRRNGVRVSVGLLRNEAERQNEVFFKWMRTGMPFVILKMAQTLDGKIAASSGASRWITSKESRNKVHAWRAENQAVLVGARTVLLDDPRLRSGDDARQPVRVILDPFLRIPLNRKIFKFKDGKTLMVCGESCFKKNYERYHRREIALLAVPIRNRRLDLKSLLEKLGTMGIISVLIEGGGETAADFLEAGLVDKVHFFIAPKILGGRAAKTSVEGLGINRLEKAIKIRDMEMSRSGDDFLMTGYVKK